MNTSKQETGARAGEIDDGEVEVTPAMKKAGGMCLTGWESMHPGLQWDDDMAEAVFRAMWKARRGAK
jgi:hypothetical protein